MKAEIYSTLDELLSGLDLREIDIVKKRIGIGIQPLSLEKIGKNYGITRERVRQLENRALSKIIKKATSHPFLEKKFYPEIHEILGNFKVKREIYVFRKLREIYDLDENTRNILRLFYIIYEKIFYEKENNQFFSHLSTIKEIIIKSKQILNYLNLKLLKSTKILKEEDVFNIIQSKIKSYFKVNPDLEDIIEFMKISKIIKKNPLNEIGHLNQKRIAPSSVGDKIKMIFEIEKRPLHFTEIWEKLNSLSKLEDELLHPIWRKIYNPRSIHNVLIHNPNFVKYGKGKYALKEWGYEAGHVIDLMRKILETKKEIKIDELYELVRKQKELSPNTFKIYLYKYFKVNKNIVSLKNG